MSISGVTCLPLYASYHPAAAELALLVHRQRIPLPIPKPTASPRLPIIQSLPRPRLNRLAACTSTYISLYSSSIRLCRRNRVAASASPSRRHLQFPASSFSTAQTQTPSSTSLLPARTSPQAQALSNLRGVLILRKGFCGLRDSHNLCLPLPISSLHRHGFRSSSTNAGTMSTLSQPQSPAALDSPLREHRHRPIERLTDRLETPSLDDRNYRVVRLPNQLEVLLVHDADTDKASAAMDVNVGNFSDEEDMPGMAHAVSNSS